MYLTKYIVWINVILFWSKLMRLEGGNAVQQCLVLAPIRVTMDTML